MNECYLLLGSNLGKREAIMLNALDAIQKRVGRICQQSAFYQSEAWGFEAKERFLNLVVRVQTAKSPGEILDLILDIEKKLGRIKSDKQGYESRKIDIDLLFFNDEIINETNLTIPHPRLHLRKFTLMPLAEIAPGLVHPVFKKSIQQLLACCDDPSQVEMIKEGQTKNTTSN